MAQLYGTAYTREALLRHVGDVAQVARVKPYRLVEGHEEGVLAVDVTTGSGLDFTVLPSRGMDISSAHWRGRSLAWRSAVTDQHPAFYEPQGLGWLRTFYGGLVVTCGLTWAGAACEDDGQALGLHGRASHIPATGVHWDGAWVGDDYVLSVSGRMREAVVFGPNIQLSRRVWARLGEDRLFIDDVVENLGYERAPHMILYHCNIGFPAVDDNAHLVAPTVDAAPRDAEAEQERDLYARLQPPTPGYREKCYFHRMRPGTDGRVTAAVVNPSCDGGEGFGVYIAYNQRELPLFTEWKMMGEGTYVCGLEPANCLVMGRDVDREAGRLQYLEPGERREYHLEIGVVSGREAIAALEAAART